MGKLKITNKNNETFTSVSNKFIDNYLAEASGEHIKIYLYLLRLMQAEKEVSTAELCEIFHIEESEFCAALKYWIKKDLLRLTYSGKVLTGITLLPVMTAEERSVDLFADLTAYQSELDKKKRIISTRASEDVHEIGTNIYDEKKATKKAVAPIDEDDDAPSERPEKHTRTASELKEFKSDEAFGDLVYAVEMYTGKQLTQADLNTLLYIYDDLGFSDDLTQYLVEYCVTLGKKQMRYMEKVAINWFDEGIRDVRSAKETYPANAPLYKSVLKALSIRRSTATSIEKQFIDTWSNTFGFDENIILEAANRAMLQKPDSANFPYVNGILESWHKQNVKTMSDIDVLDREFREKQGASKARKVSGGFIPSSDSDTSQSDDVISLMNKRIKA